MSYTLMTDPYGEVVPGILRDADEAMIPCDNENRDWLAYQIWLAAGHSPSLPTARPVIR